MYVRTSIYMSDFWTNSKNGLVYSLFQLHTSIVELQEENEKLSKMASQADYFAGVLEVHVH